MERPVILLHIRLRLLRKIVDRDDALLGRNDRRRLEKVTRGGEKVSPCVVELLHDAIRQPNLFPKKTFLMSFPLKTRGVKIFSSILKSERRLKTKMDTSQRNKHKKRASPTKRKRRQHTQTGHSRAGEHSGFLIPALSTP